MENEIEKEVKYKITSKGGLTINFKNHKVGSEVMLRPSTVEELLKENSTLSLQLADEVQTQAPKEKPVK